MSTRFYDSDFCQSKAHCRFCRKLSRGRAWRVGMMKLFVVDGGEDFKCPEDRPWIGGREVVVDSEVQDRTRLTSLLRMAENEGRPLLVGYLRQLEYMRANPPTHFRCSDKAAFRRRLDMKAEWYYGNIDVCLDGTLRTHDGCANIGQH